MYNGSIRRASPTRDHMWPQSYKSICERTVTSSLFQLKKEHSVKMKSRNTKKTQVCLHGLDDCTTEGFDCSIVRWFLHEKIR